MTRLASPFVLIPLFWILLTALGAAQTARPGTRDPARGAGLLTTGDRSVQGFDRAMMPCDLRDFPIPPAPVRAAAEWDVSKGVFIVWDNAELIDELQKDNDVYIITEDESWWSTWLAGNGIPTTKIRFLHAPTDSIWVRDYGPWFQWDGNHEFGLTDPSYYSVRPLDDAIPQEVAQAYGIPAYTLDLYHVGGNYYMDGYGNGFSSRHVYTGNSSVPPEDIDQMMEDYQGITRYITPDLNYMGEHIDTFGKLLAPDSILWGVFPTNSTPWVYSEAAVEYFETLQSPYGRPYKITRIPMWDFEGTWTPYINALQTNKKIITRRTGTSHDSEAVALYNEAAPGYEVKLVDAPGTYWGDAIHCRTRNFIDGDAIRIYPQPHWEEADNETGDYEVSAEVIPASGTSLVGAPKIFWTATGSAPFQSVDMTSAGKPDTYTGSIPAQFAGTIVYYYIQAMDLLEQTRLSPLTAPDIEGCFSIRVVDDTEPPELKHDAVHGLTPGDWPFELSCVSVDNTGIPEVTLEYRINHAPMPSVAMVREEGTFRFRGTMSGAAALGDRIEYRIVAQDSAVPPNTRIDPPFGWYGFDMKAHNDLLIIELDGLPTSGGVLRSVCDDLGVSAHYTDEWPSSLEEYDTLMICLGMSPNHTQLTYEQANLLVNFLGAGGSAYMEGGNCWAQDTQRDLYDPFFGIAQASSGSQLDDRILGVTAAFTEGMDFGHEGEKNSSDHLTCAAGAVSILTSNAQNKTVTYSTGTYRTVASSFQIDDLVERDTPSHVKLLAGGILRALGLDIDLIIHGKRDSTRSVTLNLWGDSMAPYLMFFALGPGYHPLGAKGIVRIDPGTLMYLFAGALPASGALALDAVLPADPALNGVEVYFQGYMQEAGSGAYRLTNRDRLTLLVDNP